MYSLLLALIYLAFVSLGLPDSLLGTAWPVMQNDLGAPMYFAGIISMIISAGTVVSSLLSERLTKKLGTPAVVIGSVFITAFSLLGFSLSKSCALMCVIAVPYGLGAGAIDAALNNYVALYYTSKHMSWLHCFWGVGAIISPNIMSIALANATWDVGYLITFTIQLTIAIILLSTVKIWKIHKNPTSASIDGGGELLGIRGALRIKGVPALLIAFLGYCAAETIAMLWAASYLNVGCGLSEELAAAFTSAFFVGISAGRFLSGFVADRLGDRRLIWIGTAVSLVGICIMLIPANIAALSVCGLLLTGFGFAPIYPAIIHATPTSFGKENSQAVIGIQMAFAYIGMTFAPTIFGVVADLTTIKLFPAFILLFTVLMAVMISISNKQVDKSRMNEE